MQPAEVSQTPDETTESHPSESLSVVSVAADVVNVLLNRLRLRSELLSWKGFKKKQTKQSPA